MEQEIQDSTKEVSVCRPCEEKARLGAEGGQVVAGQQGYSLGDKVRNLISGVQDMASGKYVENLTYLERKEICRKCPHRLNVITQKFEPKKVTKACKCTVCDCFLITKVGAIRGKLWLKGQSCPLGKWGEEA